MKHLLLTLMVMIFCGSQIEAQINLMGKDSSYVKRKMQSMYTFKERQTYQGKACVMVYEDYNNGKTLYYCAFDDSGRMYKLIVYPQSGRVTAQMVRQLDRKYGITGQYRQWEKLKNGNVVWIELVNDKSYGSEISYEIYPSEFKTTTKL